MMTTGMPLGVRANLLRSESNSDISSWGASSSRRRSFKLPACHSKLRISLVGSSSLQAGTDSNGAFICRVEPSSPLYEHVCVGDRVVELQLDNERIVNLTNATVEQVTTLLRKYESGAILTVYQDLEGYQQLAAKLPGPSRSVAGRLNEMVLNPTAEATAIVAHHSNRVTVQRHHEMDHCSQGIACLRSSDWKVAEEHFLNALQLHLDDELARMIARPARDMPQQASANCKKLLQLAQHKKQPVKYLLALAWQGQQRYVDARWLFTDVAKHMVPWVYDVEMDLLTASAEFHHAVAAVLVASDKLEAALVAFDQALAALDKPAWRREMEQTRTRATRIRQGHSLTRQDTPLKLKVVGQQLQPVGEGMDGLDKAFPRLRLTKPVDRQLYKAEEANAADHSM